MDGAHYQTPLDLPPIEQLQKDPTLTQLSLRLGNLTQKPLSNIEVWNLRQTIREYYCSLTEGPDANNPEPPEDDADLIALVERILSPPRDADEP